MWEVIKEFFINQYENFNGYLMDTLDFDGKILGLYTDFVSPLPELIKILGAVFVGVLLVFGTISFVKKLLKLFVVIAVILVIVLAVTQLG
jgi:hypothetical protein